MRRAVEVHVATALDVCNCRAHTLMPSDRASASNTSAAAVSSSRLRFVVPSVSQLSGIGQPASFAHFIK
ncbi:MAG: hypothetical protein JOZ41_08935 [Chloroflexi bacterium]|nr:hypothetical protein [Chloroflexota bacterium]